MKNKSKLSIYKIDESISIFGENKDIKTKIN